MDIRGVKSTMLFMEECVILIKNKNLELEMGQVLKIVFRDA